MKKNIKNMTNRNRGAAAMTWASEKSQRLYNNTDPLHVYQYETEAGNRYAYDGAFGEQEDLHFEELQRIFEEIQDEIDEDDAMERAREMINDGLYDAAVELMDDEIREELHAEIAPCSEEEFLAAYIRRHAEKFGEDFEI